MCDGRAPAAALALALCAIAACARPAEPLPIPPSLARAPAVPAPADAAPPAPPACLPAMQSPIITQLDADARTVHACFYSPELAAPSCVAIDRRRGAIATWTPTAVSTSPQPDRRRTSSKPSVKHDRDVLEVCARDNTCTAILAKITSTEFASVDIASTISVFTLLGPRFEVFSEMHSRPDARIEIADGFSCGDALVLDPMIFVQTDDCEADGHAFLFTFDGHRIAQVGGDARPLNTYGSDAIPLRNDRWAIVAPNGYAVVILDGLAHQAVIDLVPIQARATDAPAFTLVPTAGVDYVVASPSGGVGILDPVAAKLTASWIVPQCADVSGP